MLGLQVIVNSVSMSMLMCKQDALGRWQQAVTLQSQLCNEFSNTTQLQHCVI